MSFESFFFNFFVSFMQGTYKRRMRTCKMMLTLKTKEPKTCHALATTSAFNLILYIYWMAFSLVFGCSFIYSFIVWDLCLELKKIFKCLRKKKFNRDKKNAKINLGGNANKKGGCKNAISPPLLTPAEKMIGATIRIGWDIRCLPYARFSV